MSRFAQDIRHARRKDALGRRFRGGDVRQACPGWAEHTFTNFLPKHRIANPGGYTAYFVRHTDGSYSLPEEAMGEGKKAIVVRWLN